MEKFSHVKVGDIVTRDMCGIKMQLIVGHISDGLIHTGSMVKSPTMGIDVSWEEGWKFRVDNGYEVDEDLDWDGITKTGSRLIDE